MENIIFGLRPVIEAIDSGKQIDKIFVKKDSEGQLMNEFKAICRKNGIAITEVPVEKLNRMVRGNHQGVVAQISAIGYSTLEEIMESVPADETPLIVMLDGITDVRNFGAIARSAECAGAHGIIVSLKNSAPINADAVKTSAGALTRIRVCRAGSLRNTLKTIQIGGLRAVAATEKSSKIIYDCDLTSPTVIVLGNEEKGISNELLKLCDERAAIPLVGEISSLNVSAAAAVMLFETVRQRIQD